MKISKQARREAKEIFRSCIVNGLLDEERAKLAVRRLLEVRPRSYLAVLAHFRRLVKLDADRHAARIESPVPLAQDLQAAIQTGLTRSYGAGLSFAFAQNAALIGGLRIKVASDVYDGSVQARLARLQESF